MMIRLAFVIMMLVPMSASAGIFDMFSPKAVKYVKDRANETRAGYTASFDGTSGGAVYLPLRYDKYRMFEVGAGYHLQEGGDDKAFLMLGGDIREIYRKTIKKWLIKDWLQGPELPNLYLHCWANLYQGKPWVIGKETGVMATVEVFNFK